MLALWTAFRVKKAVLRLLRPLAEHGPQPSSWTDPYPLGAVGWTITLLARHQAERLSQGALAQIQMQVLTQLSGQDSTRFADETCRLSLAQDAEFIRGCREAEMFVPQLLASYQRQQPDRAGEESAFRRALWQRMLEGCDG